MATRIREEELDTRVRGGVTLCPKRKKIREPACALGGDFAKLSKEFGSFLP